MNSGYTRIKCSPQKTLCSGQSPQSIGGAEEDRTPDPLRARQVLSQLSYDPNLGPRS
ncbi:protein of unknown function [Legionella pneumophila subsp. pneumophila]|uniref:Uncharacterized protein n=1 Tax=Legionella pneumophila subsp. pneumophila TaxID=91891 RepID=A0AAV2UTD8_LEGPN|nr:protein of unknown function [Legionella pneumophila subsp. pneumophila]